MKTKTCCFTGHRLIPKDKIAQIQKLLEDEIINLINQGVTDFLNGGALGFDTLAAETVLCLKHQFPQIQLHMILPCKNQDERWKDADKNRYRTILHKADKIIYLSEKYHDRCMLDRNRYMVDNASHCVSYLTQNRGGTLYTTNRAKRHSVLVINIAENYDC